MPTTHPGEVPPGYLLNLEHQCGRDPPPAGLSTAPPSSARCRCPWVGWRVEWNRDSSFILREARKFREGSNNRGRQACDNIAMFGLVRKIVLTGRDHLSMLRAHKPGRCGAIAWARRVIYKRAISCGGEVLVHRPTRHPNQAQLGSKSMRLDCGPQMSAHGCGMGQCSGEVGPTRDRFGPWCRSVIFVLIISVLFYIYFKFRNSILNQFEKHMLD